MEAAQAILKFTQNRKTDKASLEKDYSAFAEKMPILININKESTYPISYINFGINDTNTIKFQLALVADNHWFMKGHEIVSLVDQVNNDLERFTTQNGWRWNGYS